LDFADNLTGVGLICLVLQEYRDFEVTNLISLFDNIFGRSGKKDIAPILGNDILCAPVLHLDESV
jgi:hypothetical protein